MTREALKGEFIPDGWREVVNPLESSFGREAIRIVAGPVGPGGGSHRYVATRDDGSILLEVSFQKGHRNEVGVNGVLADTIPAIVLDHLKGFQSGEFSSRENALVITKLEEAMLWIKARELDRDYRGVLGSYSR